MFRGISFRTGEKEEAIDITPLIEKVIEDCGVEEAGVIIYVPHSEAAINIQGVFASPDDQPPLNDLLKKILNQKDVLEKSKVGAAFVAPTEVLIVHEGRLLIGEEQRIYFYEFNGPKTRSIYVLIIPSEEDCF